MPNTYACKLVSNPNVPIFLPGVCTLVLFIIDSYDSTRKPLYIRKRSRAHVHALYINVNDHVHVVIRHKRCP